LNLNCEFERRSHCTWTSDETKIADIEKEYKVITELGIKAKLLNKYELSTQLPPSINPLMGIQFENQAQFNSYEFCVELAKHIDGNGSNCYEQSLVSNVTETSPHKIELADNQSSISSDFVVLATQLPIMDRSLHFSILEPNKSHCIAVRVDQSKQNFKLHDMFINADQPMRSLRTSENDNVVVVSGESFKQGDDVETNKYYQNLEKWAREHFNVTETIARWSAMDYWSTDHLPYVGYLHRGTNSIFCATGFKKWGLTTGVGAAQIITDLILDPSNPNKNPYHSLLDARRWDISGSVKGMMEEGWHTTKHLIGDKIKAHSTDKDIQSLKNGEGGIVRSKEGKVVGAYRDDEGKLHVVKPICTHMGCNVLFNTGDKIWDCACHGSQFDIDGNVIHGPACKNLERLKELEW
jgi:glycine/D-amino acid oxidase-like deaminating enzyme/nitrite reductase/ring-hydroxylating ferredoxin subunit